MIQQPIWSWPLSSFLPHLLPIILPLYSMYLRASSFSLHMWMHHNEWIPPRWSHCSYTSFWALLRCHIHQESSSTPCTKLTSALFLPISYQVEFSEKANRWSLGYRCLEGINASAEKRMETGLRKKWRLLFGEQYCPSKMACWRQKWQGLL